MKINVVFVENFKLFFILFKINRIFECKEEKINYYNIESCF